MAQKKEEAAKTTPAEKTSTRRKSASSENKKTAQNLENKKQASNLIGTESPFSDKQSLAEAPSTRQKAPKLAAASLLFQAPDPVVMAPAPASEAPEKTSRSSRSKDSKASSRSAKNSKDAEESTEETRTRTRRREKTKKVEPAGEETTGNEDNDTSSHRRRRRRLRPEGTASDEVTALKGSTRLEAKRQRRKEGRREGRKRTLITESEFLARRESVDRQMVVRGKDGLNQIAVLEDGLLVEHYVSRRTQTTMVGSVYLGKVQNVLPSMEAAFVDLGRGRNAVLYAGEVNWDAAGVSGGDRRIEEVLNPGDTVLVQVTKDPIAHKGARLTSQITLAGRYLVLVPSGSMTGISRKLPENERTRLKKILKTLIPDGSGVIVRTAAEGATEEQLQDDVARLQKIWDDIQAKAKNNKNAPVLLHGEPELALRVVRDIFNEDFRELTIQGDEAWKSISKYVKELSPELSARLKHWEDDSDVFAAHRVDEQLAKGFDRKVWLPSGGYLIIDRTEAMSVVDVNTGKFTGSGSTLEETITKNNLEAAEEIVRQLRLRDIGGIIVIDFVDMVLESNRDLVLRRLVECLGRDRTRHQVTEVTSLGLVQMTRKRVGEGLVEAFSTPCECCNGRGFIVHDAPVEKTPPADPDPEPRRRSSRSGSSSRRKSARASEPVEKVESTKPEVRQKLADIAKAAAKSDAKEEAKSTPTKARSARSSGASKAAKAAVKETEEAPPAPARRRRRAASTGVISTGEGGNSGEIVVS